MNKNTVSIINGYACISMRKARLSIEVCECCSGTYLVDLSTSWLLECPACGHTGIQTCDARGMSMDDLAAARLAKELGCIDQLVRAWTGQAKQVTRLLIELYVRLTSNEDVDPYRRTKLLVLAAYTIDQYVG
jgi:hypothetical protein